MRERMDGTPGAPSSTDAGRGVREPGMGGAEERGDVRGNPRIRDLDERECLELFARNHVGRLAYTFRDRVSIEPMSYVFDDGWLYGRTSPSEKLEVVRRSRWVAFEVDEIDRVFDWQSAVAHGAFYVLEEDAAPDLLATRRRAVELLRRLIPETGTPDDPVPHRNVMFRIHIDRLEGRRATTAPVGEREVPLE